MTKLMLAIALLVVAAGCSSGSGSPNDSPDQVGGKSVSYYHDPLHSVSCWITSSIHGIALSCLPDSQVKSTP